MTTQVFELPRVGNKSVCNIKIGFRRTVVTTRFGEEHRFSFARRRASTKVNLQAEFQEMFVHIVHANTHVVMRIEQYCTIFREERSDKLKAVCVALAVRPLSMENVIGT